MTTLPISTYTKVQSTLIPSVAPSGDFGRTLLVTTDTNLVPPINRVATYTTLTELVEDLGALSPAYAFARSYFSQTPRPKPLVVGRFLETGFGGYVVGGTHSTLAAIRLITTAGLVFDGTTLGTFSFATGNTFAGLAALLQIAIRATANTAQDDAVVSYEDGRFVVRYQLDSSNQPRNPAGVFTGTDSDALGLDAGSGAVLHAGQPLETIGAALAAIRAEDSSWTWVGADTGITTPATLVSLAQAAIALDRTLVVIDAVGTSELTANETTSLGAQLSALQSEDLAVQWSAVRDGKAASFIGFFAGTDWTVRRSLRNIFGKPLPGSVGDRINEPQREELLRKRLNAYIYVGSQAIEAEGWSARPGVWIDQRYAAYWLEWEIQRRVWAYMQPRSIGGTDEDIAGIVGIMSGACEQGLFNGALAPGTLDPEAQQAVIDASRNSDFDGRLSNGYTIVAPLASSRTDADRAARRLPGISVFAVGSEFINGVSIGIRFL